MRIKEGLVFEQSEIIKLSSGYRIGYLKEYYDNNCHCVVQSETTDRMECLMVIEEIKESV